MSRDCGKLAEMARRGDRLAFEELTQRLVPRLENQVLTRMGQRARAETEAEDIVQETLLKAWSSIGRLEWRGEEAFYRWLAAIAEHLILKIVQRSAPRRLSLEDAEIAEVANSHSRRLGREERALRLQRALAGLTPAYREVVVLTRIECLRIVEVAARMERSPNAIRKMLARALVELRHRFGDTSGSLRLPDLPLELREVKDDT